MNMAQIKNEEASHPGGAQADDINVGFIAVMVAFFAAFLLVSLIGLEALFYNQVDAETEAKTAPQGGPNTELGIATAAWNKMLNSEGLVDNILAEPKKNAAGQPEYPKINVIPISKAKKMIVDKYVKEPQPQKEQPQKEPTEAHPK
jgi:hypothetical protein